MIFRALLVILEVITNPHLYNDDLLIGAEHPKSAALLSQVKQSLESTFDYSSELYSVLPLLLLHILPLE
jgi:hypothetical protein